jgi:hypothetical protein
MKPLPLEKDFQAAYLRRLRLIPHSYWTKINDRVTVGLPDIFGSVAGFAVVIELKTRSKVSKIQAYTLKKIGQTGAHAFVVTPDNADEVYSYLLELSQRAE